MKNYLIQFLLFALLASIISCSKTGNNNSNPLPQPMPQPVPQPSSQNDSVFLWHKIDSAGDAIVDVWFTSSSKGYYISASGNIYQSIDGGNSWSKIFNSVSTDKLSLFFVNSQYGFAQGGPQIQITQDGGNTWLSKLLPTTQGLNMYFVSPSTGYYCDMDSGVYKTIDTCNTWTKVYHSATNPVGYYPFFLNANKGFVFSGDGNLYKTEDGSSTWQQIAANIATKNIIANFNTLLFLDSLNGYYATKSGLLKTIDGGISWNLVNAKGGTVNIIKFPDSNTGYYLSDAVIYKTTDAGKSWATSCKLASDTFLGMSFINATTGWACTSGGYMYRISP